MVIVSSCETITCIGGFHHGKEVKRKISGHGKYTFTAPNGATDLYFLNVFLVDGEEERYMIYEYVSDDYAERLIRNFITEKRKNGEAQTI